jgi:diketogulonate reductase-like aldo/keto reductase
LIDPAEQTHSSDRGDFIFGFEILVLLDKAPHVAILQHSPHRRQFLRALSYLSAATFLPSKLRAQKLPADRVLRIIPSTGELIPAIGMGTYITFNVGNSERLRRERLEVLKAFFDEGGGMIDSSPMYGSSEEVVGHCLALLPETDTLFSATKIWTSLESEGPQQMADSQQLWGLSKFDLQQVHNLVNWPTHLDYLRRLKEAGRIRYLGVTTSHGRRHRELESILRNEPIDFVQLTYNIIDRATEERLIPIAQERGIAVIANRPFQGGRLMDRFQDKPLPKWHDEVGVKNWAEFFLKFIISHPGVTCAIPATSQVVHMHENMGALKGRLPDQAGRERMAAYLNQL